MLLANLFAAASIFATSSWKTSIYGQILTRFNYLTSCLHIGVESSCHWINHLHLNLLVHHSRLHNLGYLLHNLHLIHLIYLGLWINYVLSISSLLELRLLVWKYRGLLNLRHGLPDSNCFSELLILFFHFYCVKIFEVL